MLDPRPTTAPSGPSSDDLQVQVAAWLQSVVCVIDETRDVFRLERKVVAESLAITLISAAVLLAIVIVTVASIAVLIGLAFMWLFSSTALALAMVTILLLIAGVLVAKFTLRFSHHLTFPATRQASHRCTTNLPDLQ